jgi:hypothetical protein
VERRRAARLLLPEAAVRKPKTFCLLSSPFLTLIYTLLAAAIRPVPREAVRDRRAVAETIRPDQNSYRATARRGQLLPGDQMLIGLDLIKDDPRLLLAYDDATGITGAFNLNLLARLSRELDANFQLRNFKYLAIWNAAESRIEMHLESVCQQTVRIPTHTDEKELFSVTLAEAA